MIISNVNIGSGPGANDGESIYSAFYKVNQNFANVQSNVNSLTNSVSSVAGRTGNVTLTINDIVGLNTSYAINSNVTQANIGMKGYVDAKIAANVAALVDSAPGALDTLNELAAALNDDASFATTIVNTITLANTIQSQQISAANIGVIGYIDLANTIQSAQIGAANLAITAANVGMKGYVDSVASQSIYGNSNVASYLPTYGGNIRVNYLTNNGNAVHVNSTLHIQGDSGGNSLFVGDPNVEITPYGNTIASFHGNVNAPVYLNVHNTNNGASSLTGIAFTSDIGDTDNNSLVLAQLNSTYSDQNIWPNCKPLDSVIDSTQGNLWIGSIDKTINFYNRDIFPLEQTPLVSISKEPGVYRGNLTIHDYVDLYFRNANSKIYFGDGSIQTTAYTGYGNAHVGAFTNLSTYAYNANITAANLGMKGYVDSVASQSIYGNANVASYLHANDYSPYSNVNVAVFTNLTTYAYNANVTAANVGMKGYVDNAVASSTYGNVQVEVFTNLSTYAYNANVTAANVGVVGYIDNAVSTANIGMKGYVDNAVATSGYSNVQVATYLPTYTGNIQAGNILAVTALRFSTGNVKITNDNNRLNLIPDTSADALSGVVIGGSGYILAPNGSRNITLNYGGGSGVVGLQANVTVGTAATSTLTVNGNTVTGNLTATGNILSSGVNGKIGYSSGGYVVQSGNTSGVTLNTVSGNIKLDTVNIATNTSHTVALTNNKLDDNDIILVQGQDSSALDLHIGAYYLTTNTALIYLRNISGSSIGPIAPALKFIIVKAPSG